MALLTRGVLIALILSSCLDPDFKLHGKNKDFLVVGHRGAPYEAAENTIDAMAAAVDLGARAVETDLCVTLDGEIVLWHDRDPDDTLALGRQEGLEGLPWVPFVPPSGSPFRRPVEELALADLREQYGYSRDGGETRDPDAPIALLADLLEWARSQSELRTVYLDVKVVDPDAAAAIVRAVEAEAPPDVVWIVMSPRRDVVEALLAEQAMLGAEALRVALDFETDGALSGTLDLGLREVSTGIGIRSETLFLDEVVDLVEARRDGRIDSVTVWTIDKRQLLGQLLFRDVDAIVTNRPEVLFELWQLTL